MCGRYYIADEDAAEELKQIIDEVNRRYNGTSGVKTAGEVFPMDIVPVIAESAGEPEVQIMRWGIRCRIMRFHSMRVPKKDP